MLKFKTCRFWTVASTIVSPSGPTSRALLKTHSFGTTQSKTGVPVATPLTSIGACSPRIEKRPLSRPDR